MIKFKTASGTTYFLDDEDRLQRVSDDPLIGAHSGIPVDGNPEWEQISYTNPPEVGYSFFYWHPTLYGCASTPVVSIEEV